MNYALTLTDEEVRIIGAGLGKLPFEVVAPLIQKLNEQLAAQQTPTEEKKPEKKK